MSTVVEKAHELANALQDCEELTLLREKETIMNNSAEAQAILQEYQRIRQQLEEKRMDGTELSEAEQKSLEAVQQKMNDSKIISEYMEAQRDFNQILQGVNFILTKALSGEEESACGPDCDGSCC